MMSDARNSIVTTTTRTAISVRASECMAVGCWLLAQSREPTAKSSLSDLSYQREHRHVHRDDDAADGDAEECDEDRLEEFHEAGHRRVDFLFLEAGDLRKNRVGVPPP